MIEAQECIVTATRRIDASAAAVFAVLTDPRRHQSFDGSGMLRGSDDGVLSAVGDVFSMRMFNDDMGDYVMDNHVLSFEGDRLLVWEPRPSAASRAEAAAAGKELVNADYRWGYELVPDGDSTLVTEFFDCSRSPQWLREATEKGTGWTEAMVASLANIEAQVALTTPAAAG